MSGKGASPLIRNAYSSKSFEVFPPFGVVEHPVKKVSLPLTTVCKFSEVIHKRWPMTMEAADTVMYDGVQVIVIVHIRIQKKANGKPFNARYQFKTFIDNHTVS